MANTKILGKRKRIALVAHDHKKADLIEWAIYNKTELAKHELFAIADRICASCFCQGLNSILFFFILHIPV